MKKTAAIFDFIFQINSLQKEEKQRFVKNVETALKPYGFRKVSKVFGGENKQYKSVRFERFEDEILGHWIKIVFEKYGKRSFFIIIGISETAPPNKHHFLGHIVRKESQPQHWSGSQWYSIFRRRAWLKATGRVPKQIPKMIDCLESYKEGDALHQRIVLR